MVAASYTSPVIRDDIRRRLATLPPLEDLLTADDLEKQRDAAQALLRPAAVLLLIVNHAAGATVLFTQRTSHLPAHGGQISFPGGRCEEGDCDPEATALRESREEVGLDPARVEILVRLPEYKTSTGFSVTPVVGWAEPPMQWLPDPHEVAEVFEVPLAFLLDAANHRHESAFYKGRMRHYWAMPFGSRFIWGATAGMLVTFQRIVAPA
jgi:8-oxo-dGTP pyrophosphatase MutT (NUDIX family)